MTRRQREVMLCIQKHIAFNSVFPSYREIATALNMRGHSNAFTAVTRLIEQKYLARSGDKITVIEPIIEGNFFIFDDETKSLKPVVRQTYTPPKRPKEAAPRRSWTNYEPSKKSIARGARKGAEAKRARKAIVTLAAVSMLKEVGSR